MAKSPSPHDAANKASTPARMPKGVSYPGQSTPKPNAASKSADGIGNQFMPESDLIGRTKHPKGF
jgi:hypothetical protein